MKKLFFILALFAFLDLPAQIDPARRINPAPGTGFMLFADTSGRYQHTEIIGVKLGDGVPGYTPIGDTLLYADTTNFVLYAYAGAVWDTIGINPVIPDNLDNDPTNELQTLSILGNDLSISDGNTVALPADNDSDPTNELQNLQSVTDRGDSTTSQIGIGIDPTYKLQIDGSVSGVAIGVTGLNLANNKALYSTGSVSGTAYIFDTDLSATDEVIGRLRNTNTGGDGAKMVISTAGSSAGDAKIQFTISGAQDWSAGIDNSSGDQFKIGTGTDLSSLYQQLVLGITGLSGVGPSGFTPGTRWHIAGGDLRVEDLAETNLGTSPRVVVADTDNDFAWVDESLFLQEHDFLGWIEEDGKALRSFDQKDTLYFNLFYNQDSGEGSIWIASGNDALYQGGDVRIDNDLFIEGDAKEFQSTQRDVVKLAPTTITIETVVWGDANNGGLDYGINPDSTTGIYGVPLYAGDTTLANFKGWVELENLDDGLQDTIRFFALYDTLTYRISESPNASVYLNAYLGQRDDALDYQNNIAMIWFDDISFSSPVFSEFTRWPGSYTPVNLLDGIFSDYALTLDSTAFYNRQLIDTTGTEDVIVNQLDTTLYPPGYEDLMTRYQVDSMIAASLLGDANFLEVQELFINPLFFGFGSLDELGEGITNLGLFGPTAFAHFQMLAFGSEAYLTVRNNPGRDVNVRLVDDDLDRGVEMSVISDAGLISVYDDNDNATIELAGLSPSKINGTFTRTDRWGISAQNATVGDTLRVEHLSIGPTSVSASTGEGTHTSNAFINSVGQLSVGAIAPDQINVPSDSISDTYNLGTLVARRTLEANGNYQVAYKTPGGPDAVQINTLRHSYSEPGLLLSDDPTDTTQARLMIKEDAIDQQVTYSFPSGEGFLVEDFSDDANLNLLSNDGGYLSWHTPTAYEAAKFGYSVNANRFQWILDTTNMVVLNSSGLGINILNPTAGLHLYDEDALISEGKLTIQRFGPANRATFSLSHADATGDFNLQQDAVGNAIFDNLAGSNLHYVGTGIHQFNVGGSEIARLTSTGLGVGVTSLEAKLDVQGGLLGGTVGDVVQTLSLRALTSNQDRLRFRVERESTGTDWTTARHYIQRQVDGIPMGYMAFGSQSDDVITWGVGSLERMRLDQNGSIGINETDPAARLHVGGTNTAIRVGSGSDYFEIEDQTDRAVIEKVNNSGSPYIDINVKPLDGTGNASVRFFRETNTTGTVGIEIKKGDGTNTNQHILRGNDNSSFAIDNSNVGIGTASPTEKFHVVGSSLFDGAVFGDYGRGLVYWEDNANDNADGAGVTLRTSANPGSGSAAGSIFAVRSSGQAPRLWVGQALTSAGANDFAVGLPTTGSEANTGAYSIYMDASEGSVKADYYRFMPQGSPPTGSEGNVYYDSTDDELKVHTGSGYESVGGGETVVYSTALMSLDANDDEHFIPLNLSTNSTNTSDALRGFYNFEATEIQIFTRDESGSFSGSNFELEVYSATEEGGSKTLEHTMNIDDLEAAPDGEVTESFSVTPGLWYWLRIESSGMSSADDFFLYLKWVK